MQEQRRLQQPGHCVRPVDDPVEVIQLPGVVKGVEDERHQAENIKVCALGGRPAPQQDVDAYAQVDEGNQAQSDVQRAVRGRQDDRRLKGYALTDDGVGGLRPDADVIELALQAADVALHPGYRCSPAGRRSLCPPSALDHRRRLARPAGVPRSSTHQTPS